MSHENELTEYEIPSRYVAEFQVDNLGEDNVNRGFYFIPNVNNLEEAVEQANKIIDNDLHIDTSAIYEWVEKNKFLLVKGWRHFHRKPIKNDNKKFVFTGVRVSKEAEDKIKETDGKWIDNPNKSESCYIYYFSKDGNDPDEKGKRFHVYTGCYIDKIIWNCFYNPNKN